MVRHSLQYIRLRRSCRNVSVAMRPTGTTATGARPKRPFLSTRAERRRDSLLRRDAERPCEPAGFPTMATP
jgi:hypothetical protein